MLYQHIVNPETNRKVKIDGKIGRTILYNYLIKLTGGTVKIANLIQNNKDIKDDKTKVSKR